MTKTATQSKTKILDAAQALIMKNGFNATSLDEICDSAGITKGGFFHYFKNKNSLGEAVAEHYWQSFRQSIKDAPFQKEHDPLKRLFGFIDYMVEVAGDPRSAGCILGSFSHEVSHSHPDIRNTCAVSFDEFADDIQKDLEAAQMLYAPSSTVDVKSVADFIISVFEGSLILMKARQDTKVRVESLDHLKRYLRTIFASARS